MRSKRVAINPWGFRVKITAALILCMLFVCVMSDLLVYQLAIQSQFNQLRGKLMAIAKTGVLTIDPEMLAQIPLDRRALTTPQYKTVTDRLRKIRFSNNPVRYVYVLAPTHREGIWQFVADPDPVLSVGRKTGPTAFPGDKYNAARFPQMMLALAGPSADKALLVDEWGASLSGYAPIKDRSEKVIAVLGIDIMADDVYAVQDQIHKRAMLIMIVGVVLSVLLGFIVSSGVTSPLRSLIEGTRRIARGDLRHQVKVKGNDEISELAASFNKMAASLDDSRIKLHVYFYNVMQSLVRIIEARDSYTRGHSDKVAENAEKIAQKLGLSPDKIEMVREAGVLHDIGKLGVQESILNKKEKLNDEEWEIIRKHPVIGEEILKPVLIDKEMLEIIRSHHERYDGKGYPDHISGEKINLISQILSVADAYDAMTSLRPYKDKMTKEEAMKELVANKGTQFSPTVVDALLEVLGEEKDG